MLSIVLNVGVFADSAGEKGRGVLVKQETYHFIDEEGNEVTQTLSVYERTIFTPFSAKATKLKTGINEYVVNCAIHASICRITLEADFYYDGDRATFGGYSWDYDIINNANINSCTVVDHTLSSYSTSEAISVKFQVEEGHIPTPKIYNKTLKLACDRFGNVTC